MRRFYFYFYFIFISSALAAQNLRVAYQYQFVPDTLQKSRNETKIMYLDIVDSRSVFFDASKYKSDSILHQAKSLMMMPPRNAKFIFYKILKDYSKPFVKIKKPERSIMFFITDKRKIDWKIGTELKTILNYKVQKATTNFAGRDWVAWFASEIPIPDGPYKFKGLPGLILELVDVSHSHQFTAVGLTKGKAITLTQYPSDRTWPTVLNVSYMKYAKIHQEHRKHPENAIRKEVMQGLIIPQGETKEEYIRQMTEIAKKKIKHDNNPIELYFK